MNDNRVLQFLGSNFGRVLMTVFFTIIIWGIEYALISTENENIALIISVICCFFGWRALNRIQPSMFLWMNFTGWMIYFVVKAILAIAVGLFVAPYQIAKAISNIFGDFSDGMMND